VAAPVEARVVGPDDQPGELFDAPRRRMRAGEPLRKEQSERTSRLNRNRLVDAEDVPLRIGGIDRQTNDALIGDVLRRGDLGQCWERLWCRLRESIARQQRDDGQSKKGSLHVCPRKQRGRANAAAATRTISTSGEADSSKAGRGRPAKADSPPPAAT